MARCGQRRYADSETDVWCASGCSAATTQTNRSVKRCASRISPFTVEFGDSARIARTSAGPSVATEQSLTARRKDCVAAAGSKVSGREQLRQLGHGRGELVADELGSRAISGGSGLRST
jgi:hypothetical protein